jgi:hypothetical protein
MFHIFGQIKINMTQPIGQNMMLVSSSFRNAKSFTMIPVTQSTPYTEAMFDPSSGILAVISKVLKQSFHMVPRLDDNGEPQRLKSPNQQTGKTVKEQRVAMDTFSEFYLTDKKDIREFIHLFAINAESYDFESFFTDVKETKVSSIIMPGQ